METYNFFNIGIYTMNLFSFILGMAFGLSTGAFNRYRSWWIVVAYFAMVAGFYAVKAGALIPFMAK